MSAVSVPVIWCAVQITLLVGICGLVSILLKRWKNGSTYAVLMWGVVGMLIATLLTWSPWPRWDVMSAVGISNVTGRQLPIAMKSDSAVTSSSTHIERTSSRELADDRLNSPTNLPPFESSEEPSRASEAWSFFAQSLADELRHVSQVAPESESTERNWPNFVAALISVFAIFGLLRFLLGIVSLRTFIRRCEPVESPRTLNVLREIANRLDVPAPRLVQTSATTTAATVGWRNPIVVLPASWSCWSELELRGVLAHELAHIKNGDFFASACTQFCVGLHFYHPLVHWLARQLRLEMEYAADATAATVMGSSKGYARTLAEMAINQERLSLGWPARTFLPTRGTLLRRIEMLRRNRPMSVRTGVTSHVAAVTLLAVSMCLVLGLRGSFANAVGTPESNQPTRSSEPVTVIQDAPPVQYVPRNTTGLLTIQPSQISAQTPLSEFFELVFEDTSAFSLGEISNIARYTVLSTDSLISPEGPEPTFGFVVQFNEPWTMGETVRSESRSFLNQSYQYTRGVSWCQPNNQTLLFGSETIVKLMLATGETVENEHMSGDNFDELQQNQIAGYLDSNLLALAASEPSLDLWAQSFSPIWSETTHLTFGANWEDGIRVVGRAASRSAEGAEQVQETIASIMTLAKNSLRQPADWQGQDDTSKQLYAHLSEFALGLIESAEFNVSSDHTLELVGETAISESVLGAFAEMTLGARRAAMRAQNMNNMKQIMLAMHNYHDAYGHLPPPIIYHRTADGRMIGHSWRVAILPFVEQAQMHDEYRMDEPWDSPHNRQFIERMPDVYRSQVDQVGSTNSSYFALVGPGTLYGDPEGTRFRDVHDGLSNTLAIVEAKQDIPWTKPEDIEWNAEAPGISWESWYEGGFVGGIADGSVRFISNSLDASVLSALVGIRDGQVVNFDGIE